MLIKLLIDHLHGLTVVEFHDVETLLLTADLLTGSIVAGYGLHLVLKVLHRGGSL